MVSSSGRDDAGSPSSSNMDRRDADIDLEDDDCLSDIGSEVSDPSQLEDIDPVSEPRSASPIPNPLIANNPFLPPHLQLPVKMSRPPSFDLIRPLVIHPATGAPAPHLLPHPLTPGLAHHGGLHSSTTATSTTYSASQPTSPASSTSSTSQCSPQQPQSSSSLLDNHLQQHQHHHNHQQQQQQQHNSRRSSSSSPPSSAQQQSPPLPHTPTTSTPTHRPLFKPHEFATGNDREIKTSVPSAFRLENLAHPLPQRPNLDNTGNPISIPKTPNGTPGSPPGFPIEMALGMIKREPHPAFNPHHEMLSQFAAARVAAVRESYERSGGIPPTGIPAAFKPRDMRVDCFKAAHDLVASHELRKQHDHFQTQEAINNYNRQNGVIGSAS